MKLYKLGFIISFFFLSFCIFGVEKTEYEKEELSLVVSKEFDIRFDSPAKKFSFYKGGSPITEKEFESLVQDKAISLNRKKLQQAKINGFSLSGALGGVAVGFFIPSLIFIVTQTNFTNNPDMQIGYNSWLDYYKKNYDSVFLPGLICIVLTGVFTFSSLIGVAVTFYLIHKYRYNEMLYRDAINRYNIALKKKYQLIPDISLGMNEAAKETFRLSWTLLL